MVIHTLQIEEDDPKYVMGGTYKPSISDKVREFARIPSLAPPPDYPVSIDDVSVWQGSINFPKMKTKAQAVYIRAGYGNNGFDSNLETNVLGAKNAGMEWGLYWFVKIGKDFKAHVSSFMNVLNDYDGKLPAVLDVEYTDYTGKNETTNWLTKLVKNFDAAYGRLSMIYTRASWWNSNTYRTDWPKIHDLMVAHYTTALQPLIPDDWGKVSNPRTWTLWQYSADGNNLGAEHGVSSDDIDRNRFHYSISEFNQKYGTSIQPLGSVPPTTEWPIPTEPIEYVTTTSDVRVRSGPGTRFPILEKLPLGTKVYAHNVDAPIEFWIEIAPGKWSAVKYNGVDLMKKSL